MKIIWQELMTILSDVGNTLHLWGLWLAAQARRFGGWVAANYPAIIVVTIGLPVGTMLILIPLLALMAGIADALGEMMHTNRDPNPFTAVSASAYLAAFLAGVGIFWLTVELADRIDKRMQGKPKEDSSTEQAGRQ
jgi:hypothetical protein